MGIAPRVVVTALVLCGVATVAVAQTSGALVALRDGDRLHPMVRYDGRGWVATCEVPRGSATRTGSRGPALVATGVGTVGVARVPSTAPEWSALEAQVRTLFRQREREQNVSPSALAAVPMTIESLAAATMAGGPRIYYFAASKSIPDGRGDVDLDEDGEVDPPGTLRVDVTGWLRAAAGSRIVPLGTNATLGWEQDTGRPADGTRRMRVEPVGVINAGEGGVWVMQTRAGDSRSFALYRVGPAGVQLLLRTGARGC